MINCYSSVAQLHGRNYVIRSVTVNCCYRHLAAKHFLYFLLEDQIENVYIRQIRNKSLNMDLRHKYLNTR
jgi:hypothetical protein